jgi:hypothetical protein
VTLFTKLVLVGLLMTWSSFGFGIVSLAQAMMLQVVYLTPSCEKAHLKKRVQQSLKMPRLVRAPALPRLTAAGTHPRACVARRVSCVCASQERLGFLRNNITLVFGAHSALWYIPTPPDSDPYNYPSFTDTFIFDDEVPPQENGVTSLSCFALLLTSAPLLVRHTTRHAHAHDTIRPSQLMGELTRMEQERQESLTVLRQYRGDDRKAASEEDDEAEEEARLTTWKAKEATTDSAAAFDPALFYGQVPRKGG